MSSRATRPDALFHALSDATRLRLLALLAPTGVRACVCELCDALDERQYNVSRHLGVLADAGLLRSGRDGRWVYYRLRIPRGRFGARLARLLRGLPDPQGRLAADRRRLTARIRLRKDGRCCVWRLDRARAS
jgi:ArsR family transcriptional regulator